MKKMLSYMLIMVLVLTFSSNSACKASQNSTSINSEVSSWGTSTVQNDYTDEFKALDDYVNELDKIIDEITKDINGADALIKACNDAVTAINAAITANDESAIATGITDAQTAIDAAQLFYDSLVENINEMDTIIKGINDLLTTLNNAGQDTSSYSITDAENTLENANEIAEDVLEAINNAKAAITAAGGNNAADETDDGATDVDGSSTGIDSSASGEIYNIYNNDTNFIFNFSVTLNNSQSKRYLKGEKADMLVAAVFTGGGNYTYQWYANLANSTEGGIAITHQTTSMFLPPTSQVGTLYYYCVATHSSGVSAISPVVGIEIYEVAPQQQPVSVLPSGDTVIKYQWGETPAALTVTASNGNAPYTYRWRKNGFVLDSAEDIANGSHSATYQPATVEEVVGSDGEQVEYYCVVIDSNGVDVRSGKFTLWFSHWT